MSQENPSLKQPLIRFVNRQQMSWRAVEVEKLIGEDHAARAIWELVGRFPLDAPGQKMPARRVAHALSRVRQPLG